MGKFPISRNSGRDRARERGVAEPGWLRAKGNATGIGFIDTTGAGAHPHPTISKDLSVPSGRRLDAPWVVQCSPHIRSTLCPRKIDLKTGLTLYRGDQQYKDVEIGTRHKLTLQLKRSLIRGIYKRVPLYVCTCDQIRAGASLHWTLDEYQACHTIGKRAPGKACNCKCLREISSCSCLTVLPIHARVLLSKINMPFPGSLYICKFQTFLLRCHLR